MILPEDHIFWYITVTLVGLILGSFATVLVHRLPQKKSIIGREPSQCTQCQKRLRPADLVPLFSWLRTRGKCRYCQAPISKVYPLTEFLCAFLCIAFYAIYGFQMFTLALIIMVPVLVAMLMIDLKHMIIPNRLNLALGLGAFGALAVFATEHSDYLVKSAFFQMMAGGLLYFLMAVVLAWGVSAALKKPALGGGDIKFFAAAGLWLGPLHLPLFMMLAGGSGVAMALVMRQQRNAHFPFAPALIIALCILLALQKHNFLTIS